MEHGLAAGHGLPDRVGVADIAGDHLDGVANPGLDVIEPSPRTAGIIFDERTYMLAFRDKFLDEMRADKTAGAGHQNFRQFTLTHPWPGSGPRMPIVGEDG